MCGGGLGGGLIQIDFNSCDVNYFDLNGGFKLC